MTASLHRINEAPVPPHLQAPILLPAGETVLRYLSHHIGCQFGRGVLTVWFAAVDYGGVAIARYYNVELRGKKNFAAPRGSTLVSDFRRVFTQPLGRLDRFPVHWLKGIQILGEIGAVLTDSNQEKRVDGTEYSVVRKLLKKYV